MATTNMYPLSEACSAILEGERERNWMYEFGYMLSFDFCEYIYSKVSPLRPLDIKTFLFLITTTQF